MSYSAYTFHTQSKLSTKTITTIAPPDLPVYGIDRELQVKQAAKYDRQQEFQARQWMEKVLRRHIGANQDFINYLRDGVSLCELVNAVMPGTIPKIHRSSMPFSQMENIQAFLKCASKLGVPSSDLFQTVDLYERKNPGQVVQAIFAFARHVCHRRPDLPQLGPTLVQGSEVKMSPSKWEDAKNTPTLQSGHYAALKAVETGATASGLNYGVRRQISTLPETGVSSEPSQQTGFHAAVHAKVNGATGSGIRFAARREIVTPSPYNHH